MLLISCLALHQLLVVTSAKAPRESGMPSISGARDVLQAVGLRTHSLFPTTQTCSHVLVSSPQMASLTTHIADAICSFDRV